MPATITTKEYFDKSIDRAAVEEEVRLRIRAGAIRSWIEEAPGRWVLLTEWNVIGEQ